MLKFVRAIVAAALVAGFSAPSLAQGQTTATPAGSATAAPAKADVNEVICQKQEVTGSRLATRRVCKTRREWADAQLQDRHEIQRVQTQRGIPAQ